MGNADEWAQLMSYIDGVRPGFSRRIRLASAEQIARYERIIGCALYRPYRQYLGLMGEFDDTLFVEACGFSETIERGQHTLEACSSAHRSGDKRM